MVTAILIPIICFYFYWLTLKEMKENDTKWLAVSMVPHEAVLTGKITSIAEERQRFYYHRYIYVQTLKLETSSKVITAKKTSPITKKMTAVTFALGDVVTIYGSWEGSTFLFSEYDVKKR